MPRRSWRTSVWSMLTSATTVPAAARAARGVGQPATGARAQTSRLYMRGQQRCGRPTRQPQAGCNSGPWARTGRPWVVGQRNQAGPRPAAEGHPRLPLRIAPPDQGAGRPLGPEPQEVVRDRPDRPDTVRTPAAEQRGRVYPAARRGRADGRPPTRHGAQRRRNLRRRIARVHHRRCQHWRHGRPRTSLRTMTSRHGIEPGTWDVRLHCGRPSPRATENI